MFPGSLVPVYLSGQIGHPHWVPARVQTPFFGFSLIPLEGFLHAMRTLVFGTKVQTLMQLLRQEKTDHMGSKPLKL